MKLPLFPTVLFLLDLGASLEALCKRAPVMACYWLSAAVLTACVVAQGRGWR